QGVRGTLVAVRGPVMNEATKGRIRVLAVGGISVSGAAESGSPYGGSSKALSSSVHRQSAQRRMPCRTGRRREQGYPRRSVPVWGSREPEWPSAKTIQRTCDGASDQNWKPRPQGFAIGDKHSLNRARRPREAEKAPGRLTSAAPR